MGNKLSSTMNSTDLESGVALSTSGSSSSEAEARPLWMRVLHRVPPRMRKNKENVYDPAVVSLGPYHHGQTQLHQLEKFKDEVVKFMLKEDEIRLLFRGKILDRIDDIRHFYGGLSRYELSDDALAQMMLRDVCTLLFFLELILGKINDVNIVLLFKFLGVYQMVGVWEDIIKLENQIPWWLMKSLISLTYNDDQEGRELIIRVLSFQTLGNYKHLKQLPWNEDGDEYNPLHFLEALRYISPITADTMVRYSSSSLMPEKRSFRSVRELKAKGIHFKPTSSFLGKISFSSYYMFGVLHLPVLAVSKDTKVAFSNIMALEMSPGSPCIDMIVTSYMIFMKSMIHSSEDVKLLQEKGIIVSLLDDNEEIVRMFKEMDTFGVGAVPFYDKIKIRINRHCDSKSRTWIAELINTYFRSPWAAIALLAAAFLLCLTFLQTYYTINPK